MSKKSKVLILGYGEMGHAMEKLLQAHCSVNIWTKHPHDKLQQVMLEDAVAIADVVLFCLPVNPHKEIATRIAPLLKSKCICLSIAKGLDEEGKTAAQIFADVFAETQPYGLLYGPMISEEIRVNRYAFAQLACSTTAALNTAKNLFFGSNLYLESSEDITGISWSVILKNVYALAFGMADELMLGDNIRGFLAVAALQELDKIVCSMGGNVGSPYHLAGLGDLITTATSENSHHHELGRMLARGESTGIEGEGIHTMEMVDKYQLLNKKDFPLYNLIHNIVHSSNDVKKQFETYLKNQYD